LRSSLLIVILVASGCATRSHNSNVEESLVSEPLPLPSYEDTDVVETAEEPASEAMTEPAEGGSRSPDGGAEAVEPSCTVEVTEDSAVEQIARFRRWLRDQSVGRRLSVEAFDPTCGDRGGFIVIELEITGPAGGLQSLSRALGAYYPGSSWEAIQHQRLESEDIPRRRRVEVRVPVGARPRPRCEWDPALECAPPASAPPSDALDKKACWDHA